MISRAILRHIKVSPRKARNVADLVRGKKTEEARNILKFTPKKPAKIIGKLLNSAISNAEGKKDVDMDNLYISKIMVDGGPTWKRFMPRAMGRASRILKRTSHITIILDEK